ncbi:MAG: hypothetical protein KAT70_05255 [Thermoplasmata archaeon]|nr:hypothetical protein [Thermoplasmata archaeon]
MSVLAKFLFKNHRDAKKTLKQIDRKRTTAGPKALRKTARWALRDIKKQVRSGTVGGQTLEPLGNMGRVKIPGFKVRANKPMAALAKRMRLKATKLQDKLEIAVGFVTGGKGGGRTGSFALSLAKTLQAGQDVTVSRGMRRAMHRIGNALTAKGKRQGKYFHLLASTTTLHTLPRPLIEPYWLEAEPEILQRVKKDYKRLLKI